ncbi:VWA domain-containing protein [Niveispirillum cyanobacteriorum]|uniref:Magnesium chelatase ATPase subunit D n=1 Tax=Niveispirillum cyanobacteriorum TaxID=1612173 RepID=A0A2K9NGU6_9PROT|nr:VWA domain-containing protein [Niveispirillum cyanobacteriorum]AUN32318.1 magnesium chelatase ATPase subunit D [Niveispirillum cyanobacteriorum]GGE76299.1 Mg-protoporphyrin IX chelatase [Niveispirillum cyanobacteriorum]
MSGTAMHEDGDGPFDALQRQSEDRWRDAMMAARILAVAGPQIGGLWLTARASGIRDHFLDHLCTLTRPWRATRLPPGTTATALCGHLDIARSTAAGRIVWDSGILAAADGGILFIPMAERLDPGAAAMIAEAMDTGTCPRLRPNANEARHTSRVTIVALDEASAPEEMIPSCLSDRLGLHIQLDGVMLQTITAVVPDTALASATDWRLVRLDDGMLEQLCAITSATGHMSVRVLHHVSKVTRIHAALGGRSVAEAQDAVAALRLCLGVSLAQSQPPADQAPPPPESAAAQDAQSQPPPGDASESDGDGMPQELDSLTELLAAVEQGAVDGLTLTVGERAARQGSRTGKGGATARNVRRGRPFGSSNTPPFPDARPDLVETLRAAAPWQRLRTRLMVAQTGATPPALLIRKEDFRYRRRQHQQASTAIFVVDASGSTALERLGETKGAIEQLLASCYVRRDEVSLIAFRGKAAEILMQPTRSLVAAKRKLAALPGGGPTPLASGLERGLEMALAARRRGSTPVVVVMTDGSGNIALDGTADRALAGRQTETIARLYRAQGLKSICIDIARRPRDSVTNLAGLLGADLHLLRQANAAHMSEIVRASMHRGPPV